MKELENYIKTLRSERTKDNYNRIIQDFLEYKEINDLNGLKNVDINDLFAWRDYLMVENQNSESTAKLKFTALSGFYNYLKSNPKYEIIINPVELSQINKKIRKINDPARRTWLTTEEKQKFLSYCKTIRDIAICSVFLNTAIRVSELINLELSKYTKYQNNNGEIASFIYFRRKGGKIKKLYFNPSVTKKIDNYLKTRKSDNCDRLFTSNAGHPMSTQSIDRTINTIAKNAGINKRISAHSLRRTLATDMHKQNIDLKSIQMVLGHSNPGVTGLYIQEIEEDTEDLMMNYVVE